MICHMFIRSIWLLLIFHQATYHIYQGTINWTPPYLPDFTRCFFIFTYIYQIFIWIFTINWRPMGLLFSGQAAFREDSKAHVSREVPLAISESPAVLVEVCRICGGCIHEWDINGIYIYNYIYNTLYTLYTLYILYILYIWYILYISYILYGILMKCICGIHNI